jgi:Cu-Zn family superoxide dismutase
MKLGHTLILAGIFGAPAAAEILGLGIGKDTAEAVIIDPYGIPLGKAVIKDSKKKGLQISIVVKGLKAGERAVHIHAIGKCEGPGFASAGADWNPTNKLHGRDNPQGPHLGDMPNLLVNKKGRATLKHEIPDARFGKSTGLLDDDGASIVIHALSDDHRTDPGGNSGDRIACGVIREK